MACVKYRRNRWIVDFRDQDGKRRWESFEDKQAAYDALAKRIKELKQGTYRAPSELPTVADVAARWLATKEGHRVSSYAQWQVHLDLHIVPSLGTVRVDQLRIGDVDRFREDRRRAGLAPQTVNKLLTTLTAVLKFAMRQDWIDRNPAAIAERCRMHAEEVSLTENADTGDVEEVDPDDVLTPEEAERLICAATPGFDAAYLMVAVFTGLRISEQLALTWDDVNWDTGIIHVQRTASWARRRGSTEPRQAKFSKPKTPAGDRRIKIDAELIAALKTWKLACPPGDLIFPRPDGTPTDRTRIAPDVLNPTLKRAGLKRVTPHNLRHSYASSLIMLRRSVTEVSYLIGHSDPTVTLRVYAHWFRGLKTDTAADLEALILKGRGSRMVAERGSRRRVAVVSS